MTTSFINALPNKEELQAHWDHDPLGFYCAPMTSIQSQVLGGRDQQSPELSGWTAAQFALATQPLSFWRDKNPPAPDIWRWAIQYASVSVKILYTLVELNVPCNNNDAAELLLQSYQKKFPRNAMEKVFPHLLKVPDLTKGHTAHFSFMELVLAHENKKWLELLEPETLNMWRHASTGDTVLHRCVRQEWKAGVIALIHLGVKDCLNKEGMTAQELAQTQFGKGWSWPTRSTSSSVEPSATPIKKRASPAPTQSSLF